MNSGMAETNSHSHPIILIQKKEEENIKNTHEMKIMSHSSGIVHQVHLGNSGPATLPVVLAY